MRLEMWHLIYSKETIQSLYIFTVEYWTAPKMYASKTFKDMEKAHELMLSRKRVKTRSFSTASLKLQRKKNCCRKIFIHSRWKIDGETIHIVRDFILGGSKITADGDCSHEMKRRLLLGRKAMTNLDSILKSRDITLPTKVRLVKGKVFPVVMYGCESWTIKKAEDRRTDAFELWCWRRLLRVP